MKEERNKFLIPWWIWLISIILILSSGYYDFYVTFEHQPDFIIKVLPIIFGLFAIYLTIRRMRQTQEQIEVMSDNNKFNNYNRHRDQFIEQINVGQIIHHLHIKSHVDKWLLVRKLYSHFYCNSYKEFSPNVRKEALNLKIELEKFIEIIVNQNILDFTDLNIGTLHSVDETLTNTDYTDLLIELVNEVTKGWSQSDGRPIRMKVAFLLFFNIHFYKIILIREGMKFNSNKEFENMMYQYFNQQGITSEWGIIKI